ncbi:MAG: hypothetical protein ACXWPM_08290 [Bdellovibrionota bacterium]
MSHCAYGSGSCGWYFLCAAVAVAWWLIGSALLWQTWNKVIKVQFAVKPAKYWHAVLLIGTIGFLCCLPRAMSRRNHCEHHEKGNCPYASQSGENTPAPNASPGR